ncbi:hypothetical protein RB620_05735 [Paenibacillus sp. LHD-117]|uniref:hypothetical protein n=1 Tax=Paenibacillus sp. LHD-117 TaxID=3071412 RepID=UPI0027E0D256|nr:hypothetical protein [Paenibacillus sp. LHD-117]MDQ6418938.1 hypothetical protein [Paenibacillus sp. LHD-117]
MRKSALAISATVLAVVVLLALPGWNKSLGEDRTFLQSDAANRSLEEAAEAPAESASALVPETVQNEAAADAAMTDRFWVAAMDEEGVRLSFAKDHYVQLHDSVTTGDAIVHFVSRSRGEGEASRYDAIVVRPKLADATSFHLFDSGAAEGRSGLSKAVVLDSDRILFLQAMAEEELLVHSLVSLNIHTGELEMVVPRFWSVNLRDEAAKEDFILGHHVLRGPDGSIAKLMVTSFKGKLWVFSLGRGNEGEGRILVNSDPYPAYGDVGSKPPHELLYPSPDLERFVYQSVDENQIITGNDFRLVDTDGFDTIASFNMNESLMPMDMGIRWNGESSRFFLEYARSDRTLGIYYDNAHYLFAEGVRFYDRDGKLEQELKAPEFGRLSVFGWADEHHALIEEYRPEQNGEEWAKGKLTYKLFDVRNGKLRSLTTVRETAALADPVIIPWAGGNYGYDSASFLLLDRANGRVWEPSVKGRLWQEGEKLRLASYTYAGALLYGWDENGRRLALEGFNESNDLLHVTDDWLVVWDKELDNQEQALRYAPLSAEADKQTDDGLALLSSPFAQAGANEWWTESISSIAQLEKTALRAEGESRFGKLRLRALPGEFGRRDGGSYNYYGTYEVEFVDADGAVKALPPLRNLELLQDGEVGRMHRMSFPDYDLLFFQTRQYSFSQGHDRTTSPLYAYAVTKQGEAFPLTFSYEMPSGLATTPDSVILQHTPIIGDGDAITTHAMLGDGHYELAWKPDLASRTLTLAAATSREREDAALRAITQRSALLLSRALGLTESEWPPDGPMNEDKLRELFTDQAWSNPGFQRMKQDFAGYAAEGNPSRAFPWPAIGAEFIGPDTVRVTFMFNLIYAIGKAAHLEATLKLVGHEWSFHDFGTLETERWESDELLPGYDGLVIRDELEL